MLSSLLQAASAYFTNRVASRRQDFDYSLQAMKIVDHLPRLQHGLPAGKVILLCSVSASLLAGCKRISEPESATPGTVSEAKHSAKASEDSQETRGDSMRSLASSLDGIVLQDSTSPRISIARIDSALRAYDAGDTLKDTLVGMDECSGDPIREVQFKHGLLLSGSRSGIYADDWIFSGNFDPVLGLSPGMDTSEVIKVLGKPRVRSANAFRYVSQAPENRDSDLFEARWVLEIVFVKGRLIQAAFQPSQDDC